MLASEKIQGLSTCLTFLGITLDTTLMLFTLLQDKLQRIKEVFGRWLLKKTVTKREILSIVEPLQHTTRVIQCGMPSPLLHHNEQRILVRYCLVAHLYSLLEWSKHAL